MDIVQIGEGFVYHGRPLQKISNGKTVKTSFRYSIFNLIIPVHNTEAVRELSAGRILSISCQDYLEGRPGNLFQNLQEFMLSRLGYTPEKVWLQTLPKLFGFVFNPVNFWFCYKNEKLDAVLCEVNNTFGDRHFYFVPLSTKSLPKRFHVSPFFPVSGSYQFEFDKSDTHSDVKIRLYEENELKLNTSINLKLETFSRNSIGSLLLKYGWMTALIVVRIHFQAFKLWLKRVSYFSRPQAPKENITL